jgi:hypothetical protein
MGFDIKCSRLETDVRKYQILLCIYYFILVIIECIIRHRMFSRISFIVSRMCSFNSKIVVETKLF